MKRIIDANLNRAVEASRILEEIARFYLDDGELSEQFKKIRHEICQESDNDYYSLLKARDSQNDVGAEIKNPTERKSLENIFKANIKRLQQALRVLSEYSFEGKLDGSIFESVRYLSYTLEKQMWEKLCMKLNRLRLQGKKLYLVTNSDKFNNDDDFLNAVASALKGGVQLVQLREKSASASRIIELGKKIRELCSIYGALFIINDRIDIAQILEADGVHLGQDDIEIQHAREILGTNFIIGISTHKPEQALKAQEQGADYIGVGPVFETPTKQGRKAVGLDYIKWASENINIPFFAIGGIDLVNVDEVTASGAKRVAVVRAIINSVSPEESAKLFLNKLNKIYCSK